MQHQKLTKVSIRLPPDEEFDSSSEVLWAERRSANEFSLRNVPALAYGYAYDDTVVAETATDGTLVVCGVVRRGGHSTYRVIASNKKKLTIFNDYCRRLRAMGCGMECAIEGAMAIDVPPTADVYDVCALLEEGGSKGVWEFEEAYMGHRPS